MLIFNINNLSNCQYPLSEMVKMHLERNNNEFNNCLHQCIHQDVLILK